MFTGPEHTPMRLQVDIQEHEQWRTVFVQCDPERTWLDGWLSHHRIVQAVAYCGEDVAGFAPFAAWLAEAAARDFPEAQRVRVRYFRCPTPAPLELRAGRVPEAHGIAEAIVVVRRSRLLPEQFSK